MKVHGGPGTLAIVDSNGALDDEIAIDASPIASTRLVPGGLDALSWSRRDDVRAWFLHTGTTQANLAVALYDAGGARLVDEDMSISADGAQRGRWDTFTIDAGDVDATIVVTVTSGGASSAIGLGVVDSVETIDPQDATLDDGSAIVRASDGAQTFCFRGVHG